MKRLHSPINLRVCKIFLFTFSQRLLLDLLLLFSCFFIGNRRDRMVVGFTTTYTISGYYHKSGEFEFCSWGGVLDTTLCDKVCQWLVADWWFSPGTPVSSTNKTNLHDITEILLKVAINTITLIPTLFLFIFHKFDLSLGIEPHWWYNVYCGWLECLYPGGLNHRL